MIGWRDGGLAAAVAAHLAVMFGGLGAAAQEQPVRALPCGGDAIARGAAGRIVDGRTFALEDGREVRLAAIEVPPLAPPGEAREAEAAPGGVAAKDALAALLEGADIVLRRADVAADRYGRILAYTATAREGVERSVQADLIARRICPRRRPDRHARMRDGTPRPRTGRAQGQAWPLGHFVL